MGATTARTLRRTVAGLLALSIGGGGSLFAADRPDPVPPQAPPVLEGFVEKIDEKAVEKIDDVHEDQEHFLGVLFEKVDRVFGEQYVEDRERKAQVRAGLETTFNDQGTSTDTKVKAALRVPLPALNRRLNGFLDIGEDVNALGAVSSPNFSESEKFFSIAAGIIRRFRDDLEAGIKLNLFRQSGEFFSAQPFARFEKKSGRMRYYLQEQIIWDSDNSWSTITDLDADRRFRSGMFVRLRNRLDYTFGEPGAMVAHGLIVRRGVFETSGLSFEAWLEYSTAKDDPKTLDDDTILYAQLRFRGRIFRNWLEYELRPIYTIPANMDRKAFFGFLVNLTVVWDSYLGGGNIAPADIERR